MIFGNHSPQICEGFGLEKHVDQIMDTMMEVNALTGKNNQGEIHGGSSTSLYKYRVLIFDSSVIFSNCQSATDSK